MSYSWKNQDIQQLALEVQTGASAAIPAGEAHIGSVGGNTEKINFSVTTSATAYTANDNIGGVITLTDILRINGGTGVIEDIDLWCLANQKPNLYIDLWLESPKNGTYLNDNPQIITGDQFLWLGHIEVSSSDWKDTGVISRCSLRGLGLVVKGKTDKNLYLTLQDKTGVNFGSTSGMYGKISILQD